MKKIRKLSDIGLTKGSSLLAVMPHPDDETGFAGGFLRYINRKGITVNLLCVTDGAASTLTYGVDKQTSLAETREKELIEAAKVLHIQKPIFGRFPDGMTRSHTQEIQECMIDTIAQLRPAVVLTLEPDGGYGHPDHIEVSRIVTEIYKADPSFTLLYTTVKEGFQADEGSRNMAEKEIHPLLPTMYLTLSPTEIYAKFQALRSHKSQFSSMPGSHMKLKDIIQSIGFLLKEYFVLGEEK